MKSTLVLLFFLILGTAFGQFIPQPMGYNPDENSDGLIGVADLQGLLALYGNVYDNGDSLNVEIVDPFLWVSWQDTGQGGQGSFAVPEGTDVLYIDFLHVPVDVFNVNVLLPQETGFKTLLVFWDTWDTVGGSHRLRFFDGDPDVFGNTVSICDKPGGNASNATARRSFFFIHGHDGKWYPTTDYSSNN